MEGTDLTGEALCLHAEARKEGQEEAARNVDASLETKHIFTKVKDLIVGDSSIRACGESLSFVIHHFEILKLEQISKNILQLII